MNLPKPYEWQSSLWAFWQSVCQQGRIGHAWLLSGPKGLGKAHFAKLCASQLLNGALESHPDGYCLQIEDKQLSHKIDSIRHLQQQLRQTAQKSGYRVVLIEQAHLLTGAAANALLKLLEEPGERTVFFLVTDFADQLLATLKSRCQKLAFSKLSWQQWQAGAQQLFDKNQNQKLLWSVSHGCPLLAQHWLAEGEWQQRADFLTWLKAPSYHASKSLRLATPTWLARLMLSFYQDLYALKLALPTATCINTDSIDWLQRQANNCSWSQLRKIGQLLQQCYADSIGMVSLNNDLLRDRLFIQWQQYFK